MFIGLKLLKQNEASIIVSDTLSVLVGLVPSLMFLRFQLQARQSRYKTSRLTVQTLATYGGTHGVDAGGGVVSTIRFAAHHDDETNTLPSLTVAALADEYEIPLDSISREIGKSVEIKRCPQSHEL
ncbi:hypothetical protein FRC03_008708 [Tulasnella sp. 419]|nr:hypothetical protein FRC03_008708 [Tulasnella sp. 419]